MCEKHCSDCIWFYYDEFYYPEDKETDEILECLKHHDDRVGFRMDPCEDFKLDPIYDEFPERIKSPFDKNDWNKSKDTKNT